MHGELYVFYACLWMPNDLQEMFRGKEQEYF